MCHIFALKWLVFRTGIVTKQQWIARVWMDGVGRPVVAVRQTTWARWKGDWCRLGTS